MDLETIKKMWDKDSVLDDTLLDEESLRIPVLHSKYLGLYSDFKLLMSKAQVELKTIKHKQWLYYSGKEVPEDAEPFDYKVIRSDIPHWIGVDERVIKAELKIEYYDTILYTLSDILKQINNRNFMIKSAIDWRRFTSGG